MLQVVDPHGSSFLVDGDDRGDEGADDLAVDAIVEAVWLGGCDRIMAGVCEGEGELFAGAVGRESQRAMRVASQSSRYTRPACQIMRRRVTGFA